MIRVFHNDKALDLADDHPALGSGADHEDAERVLLAGDGTELHVLVDDGEAWVVIDGVARPVRVESRREAAVRLAAERDAEKARADAAEKRLADLQERVVNLHAWSARGRGVWTWKMIASEITARLDAIARRIDGKEGT